MFILNVNCGVSVSHKSEGHAHEAHGHRTTTSSGHGEEREREEHNEIKAERKGISFICSGGNVLHNLHSVVYLWCSKYTVDKLSSQAKLGNSPLKTVNSRNVSKCSQVNVNKDCVVSVLHVSEGHIHETHGHKINSSGHGEEAHKERKADREGISFVCSGSNVLVDLYLEFNLMQLLKRHHDLT